MMRCSRAFFGRGFGRADIEFAIDGDRVTAYDLSVHLFREMKRECGLTAARGPQHHQKKRLAQGALQKCRSRTSSTISRAIKTRPRACCRGASIADIVMIPS